MNPTNQHQSQPTKPHYIHPDFPRAVAHLKLPLHPLVSMTTGQPHPNFPTSILNYQLLSSSDLDNLAQHYHQTSTPSYYTSQYPRQVPSWEGKNLELEVKRRRFGRFIGMRGCESPIHVVEGLRQGETMEQKMEREWTEMMRKSRGGDDEEALRRKTMGFW
jgi:hypothetical protein